jgi:peptidoglycan/LPS O-acetylase OafA/YrhL
VRYRSEIDGLRALAVVPVVLFHAGVAVVGGGFVGVDVFFVISGYLITSILLEELDTGTFSIRRFYERRARRILPALFFLMAVVTPFAWAWLMPSDLKDFAGSQIATTVFASNVWFWLHTGYFDSAADLKPLLHTWSLAVEEQYYILFPLILSLSWRLGQRISLATIALLAAASLLIAQWGVSHAPAATYFLLPARAWELLVGSFIALYLRTNPRLPAELVADGLSLAGIALIAVPMVTYTDQTPFPGLAALPPVLGTALIILFASPENLAGRLLSLRPVVGTGLLAYSFYLWHQPVFALYRQRFGDEAFHDHVPLLVLLSFAMAALSYRIIEQPFRRKASLRQLKLAMLACFSLAIIASGAILRIIDIDKALVPSYRWALSVADPDLIAYAEGSDTHMACTGLPDGPGFVSCRFGAFGTAPGIALWGDSLAGAFLHGLDHVARDRSISGTAFIANGCPPVVGLANRSFPDCSEKTNAAIVERLKTLPKGTTVLIVGNFSAAMSSGNILLDGAPTSPEAILSRVRETADLLRKAGIKTVIVEQGPAFPEPAAEYRLQNLRRAGASGLDISRKTHEASLNDARRLASATDGYVFTADLFCNADLCPALGASGELVVYDKVHITKATSVRLAAFVLDRLNMPAAN